MAWRRTSRAGRRIARMGPSREAIKSHEWERAARFALSPAFAPMPVATQFFSSSSSSSPSLRGEVSFAFSGDLRLISPGRCLPSLSRLPNARARKKINTRQVHGRKASPRRGNYVGPRALCALARARAPRFAVANPGRLLYELPLVITKRRCTMTR